MSTTSNTMDVAGLDRMLVGEVARVTEVAAIAAAKWRGRGNNKAADGAAVDAMRKELGNVHIRGRVVIGEGEMDEAPMLYIGEEVGIGDGPEVDIAVDPLEGTTICAKDMPNALAVMAISERGGLLHAPDMYMDKIAVGPGYPDGIIDLDATPEENLRRIAMARGVGISAITACVLDRPRHADLVAAIRKAGAGIRLIPDGDIAGVIWTTDPKQTGIDIYIGSGGAPEGVLAAAALRCIGGQMQGRLLPADEKEKARALSMGIKDVRHKYTMQEMASGDVIFAASGVTDGSLLAGVHFRGEFAETETLVMRSKTGTVRRIKTTFRTPGHRAFA
jgi:fructose-1,6-bisphosphatase II / sedoheptulose-1,7-bisphosphatase